MPRSASSSARCGPTPLIMRTSVLRLIAIESGARKAGDVLIFISFQLGTYCNCETCVPALRTDRVRIPCPKRGGLCDGRPPDRFRQARAAALGGGGNPWRFVRLQILFPGVPGSLR